VSLGQRLKCALWRREGILLHQVVPLLHPFLGTDIMRPALQREAFGIIVRVRLEAPLKLGVERVAILVLRRTTV